MDNSNNSFIHGDNDSSINAINSVVFGENNVLKADPGVVFFSGNSVFGRNNKIEAFSGDWVSTNMVSGTSNTISGYAYYTNILGSYQSNIDATNGDIGRSGIYSGGSNHITHGGIVNPSNTQSAVIVGGNNDTLIGTHHSGIFSGIKRFG